MTLRSPSSWLFFTSVMVPLIFSSLNVQADTGRAENIAVVTVTNVPFAEGRSLVLMDHQTQCRYIGTVAKLARLVDTNQPHTEWVMVIKEKWCRPTVDRPERMHDFHVTIIDLPQPLAVEATVVITQ